MDLFCAETISFDAFLKFISPLSGLRHVSILKFAITPSLCKLWDRPELVVADAVEDQADLLVGFEEASFHS